MTFDSPAIDGRRLYLLDPKTNGSRRLDATDAFQDAPLWSDDGLTLYYVERHGDTLVLMASNLSTGEAAMVEDSERPLPEMVGYYGQSNWEEVWATSVPALPSVPTVTATPLPTMELPTSTPVPRP
jgi:hypothetical protein